MLQERAHEMMNGGGHAWVEGQRKARGMMNGGGWRDRGEPVEWIMVGSEAIDFHAYSTSCPPAL